MVASTALSPAIVRKCQPVPSSRSGSTPLQLSITTVVARVRFTTTSPLPRRRFERRQRSRRFTVPGYGWTPTEKGRLARRPSTSKCGELNPLAELFTQEIPQCPFSIWTVYGRFAQQTLPSGPSRVSIKAATSFKEVAAFGGAPCRNRTGDPRSSELCDAIHSQGCVRCRFRAPRRACIPLFKRKSPLAVD